MVFDKVKALLAEQLMIDADKIAMESDILADLGADSLDVVELIMALEEEFGFSVPEEKIAEFKTVGSIVNFIETNK